MPKCGVHGVDRIMGGEWSGFVAAGAAVVLFGSYAVPTKLVDTHDGLFFQWVRIYNISYVGGGVSRSLCASSIQFYLFSHRCCCSP
jgi:hypothetical protein